MAATTGRRPRQATPTPRGQAARRARKRRARWRAARSPRRAPTARPPDARPASSPAEGPASRATCTTAARADTTARASRTSRAPDLHRGRRLQLSGVGVRRRVVELRRQPGQRLRDRRHQARGLRHVRQRVPRDRSRLRLGHVRDGLPDRPGAVQRGVRGHRPAAPTTATAAATSARRRWRTRSPRARRARAASLATAPSPGARPRRPRAASTSSRIDQLRRLREDLRRPNQRRGAARVRGGRMHARLQRGPHGVSHGDPDGVRRHGDGFWPTAGAAGTRAAPCRPPYRPTATRRAPGASAGSRATRATRCATGPRAWPCRARTPSSSRRPAAGAPAPRRRPAAASTPP